MQARRKLGNLAKLQKKDEQIYRTIAKAVAVQDDLDDYSPSQGGALVLSPAPSSPIRERTDLRTDGDSRAANPDDAKIFVRSEAPEPAALSSLPHRLPEAVYDESGAAGSGDAPATAPPLQANPAEPLEAHKARSPPLHSSTILWTGYTRA